MVKYCCVILLCGVAAFAVPGMNPSDDFSRLNLRQQLLRLDEESPPLKSHAGKMLRRLYPDERYWLIYHSSKRYEGQSLLIDWEQPGEAYAILHRFLDLRDAFLKRGIPLGYSDTRKIYALMNELLDGAEIRKKAVPLMDLTRDSDLICRAAHMLLTEGIFDHGHHFSYLDDTVELLRLVCDQDQALGDDCVHNLRDLVRRNIIPSNKAEPSLHDCMEKIRQFRGLGQEAELSFHDFQDLIGSYRLSARQWHAVFGATYRVYSCLPIAERKNNGLSVIRALLNSTKLKSLEGDEVAFYKTLEEFTNKLTRARLGACPGPIQEIGKIAELLHSGGITRSDVPLVNVMEILSQSTCLVSD